MQCQRATRQRRPGAWRCYFKRKRSAEKKKGTSSHYRKLWGFRGFSSNHQDGDFQTAPRPDQRNFLPVDRQAAALVTNSFLASAAAGRLWALTRLSTAGFCCLAPKVGTVYRGPGITALKVFFLPTVSSRGAKRRKRPLCGQ